MKKSLHLLLAALLVTVGACSDDPLVTDPVNGPTADAGNDQTEEDVDGSGDEVVLLDGSGSTAGDAAIATYAWSEGGVDIGGGPTLSATFDVGVHDVLLTVTDEAGLSDTDNVLITVEAQAALPPTVTIVAPVDLAEFDEGADVTFEGNAVDQFSIEIPPEDLEWTSERDGVLGTGNSLTVNTLSVGEHGITLTAVDSDGVEGTSRITIRVNEVLVVSFADDILPYFEASGGAVTCTACHGAAAQQGGIRLDSYAEVSTGVGTGPLIVAGNSADPTAVLLPKVLADHNDGSDDAAFAVDLAQWIDDGAEDN
jgi:hypothetical protein